MKLIRNILFIAFLFAMIIPAEGQILERMTKRATRKIENKINREADKTVDKAFDKLFNEKKDMRGKPKDRSGDYEYEDEYEEEKSNSSSISLEPNKFLGSIEYEMTTETNGKNSVSNIGYTFDNDRTCFVADQPDNKTNLKVIFHHTDGKMTSIIKSGDDEPAGFKTKIRSVTAGHDPMETDTDILITETGESRIILGYNCTKYTFKSFDGIDGECWVTDDPELVKVNDALLNLVDVLGAGSAGTQDPAIAEKGFPLESSGVDKNGNPFSMKVLNVNVGMINPAVFSTEGVTVTDVSEMMPGN